MSTYPPETRASPGLHKTGAAPADRRGVGADAETAIQPLPPGESEECWNRRLLDVGRALTCELDQSAVLDRVLETARQLTAARYAAIGILNEKHTELERFLTLGVDDDAHTAIGDLPRGRGVLGLLIDNPRPLRLTDVGDHPRSYGFPGGHPVMRSFLGVPIMIRGQAWGNLYLTEKDAGQFTERDEEAAVILADWAAIAIENSRLYATSERLRAESERTTRGLEVTRDVAVAIGSEVSLERVLELIAKRGRALVQAAGAVIWLHEGEDLVVRAGAGRIDPDGHGLRLPAAGGAIGQVLESRRPKQITDIGQHRRFAASTLGDADAHCALLVPMLSRGSAVGVVIAFDGAAEGQGFSEEDEQLLMTFTAGAANAVTLAQSVESDRLRNVLAAKEAERARWARELHDETLQNLAGLRMLLASTLRRDHDMPPRTRETVDSAVAHVEREIESLRTIISELRPPALDELGLLASIESLIERQRENGGLEIDSELTLLTPAARQQRLGRELESAVYRLVQEAMTNAVKHASATTIRIVIDESDAQVTVEVRDDGCGFDPGSRSDGFGLTGMRERVSLAGGTLDIATGSQGTHIRACLPIALEHPHTQAATG